MKKIICAILAVVVVFTGCAFGAAAKQDVTPVIVVGGVGTRGYYMNAGAENEVSVFPPSIDYAYILKAVSIGVLKTVLTKDLENVSEMVALVLENIFDGFMCDENGDSKYDNVGSLYYPLSVDNYDFDYSNDVPEIAIAGVAAEYVGAQNTYFYNYDWRLDPQANASGLAAAIKAAKEKAGSDKVSLVACSMGGVQTLSYLAQYGYDDVEKILLMSSAHKGLVFVSELFSGEIYLGQQDVFTFLSRLLTVGNQSTDDLFDYLCINLGSAGFLKPVFSFLNDFAKDISNETFYSALRNVFGNMPGMWAFVCQEYYKSARDFMTTDETSAELLSKIDSYYENVSSKSDEILKEAADNGVSISVFSHYNKGSIPVTHKANIEGDYLIETVCTSIGATAALANETFGDDYVCQKQCSNHNHLSPDYKIDASTCLFPDSTWFIKGEGHVGCKYGSDYAKLVGEIIAFNGQPTVYDFVNYPQFLQADITETKLSPITGRAKPFDLASTLKEIVQSLVEYVASLSYNQK